MTLLWGVANIGSHTSAADVDSHHWVTFVRKGGEGTQAMAADSTSGCPSAAPSGPRLPGMFTRYKSRIEDELGLAVPETGGADVRLLMGYHLGWLDQHGVADLSGSSQGKALRPTLCLFACEALAASSERAVPAAAALELIHNFSLLHDDIQDQDLERRHQPTAWSLWGIPRALVAGDAMHCTGDLATLRAVEQGASDVVVLRVSEILTNSYLAMIEGQCLDLEFEGRTDITTDEYLHMIACKTGALIRCGLETGAMLAEGDEASVRAFATFGEGLGRAFQIRDDYLGIWGDEATLGKATGNDIRRRKKSFPVVFALERAAGAALDDMQRIYGRSELEEDDVERVLAILDEVGAREQSQSITEEAANRALDALAPVKLPDWARTEAEELVDFLARREY